MAEKTTLATSGEDMDVILSYVDGYRSVLVLNAACEMELFDKVNQSPEGVTAAKLAEDNEWDEDATHRLLNGCVALKTLLKSTGQDGKEIYKLAGPGRYLQKHSDPTVWEMTTSWAKRMFGMITKLPEEVRTAKNKDMAFPRHVTVHKSDEGNHGDEEQGHGHHSHGHGHGHGHSHGHGHGHGHGHSHGHGHGNRDPQELLIRYRSMGGCIEPYLNDLLKAFDLSRFRTAVDLGAGNGSVTFGLSRLYPSMSVTFFDVAPVTSIVQEHLVPKEKSNISFMAGDFFETDLPVADLYVLGRIVHDWKSDQVATLLQRVFNATNSGGAIVLLEKNMNDAKDGPISAHVWDLMVMSHCGGKLRSAAEYTTLLQAAGYKDVKVAVTSDPCPLDVIMATKP